MADPPAPADAGDPTDPTAGQDPTAAPDAHPAAAPPDDGPPALAGALGEVVDDLDARRESEAWALAQLENGRSPEEVEAELVASGWPADDAAEMAEQARKETRHLRGVVTREDVSRGVEANYRRTMRRLPLIAFGWLPGIFITFSNLLRSFAGMRKLKEVTEHTDHEPQGEGEEDDPPELKPGG